MASNTVNGKVALLSTSRANVLPKFVTDGEERYDKSKQEEKVPSATEIRELLTISKDGNLPIEQRQDVMQRIETARAHQSRMRKSREKDLFVLDTDPLDTLLCPANPNKVQCCQHSQK